MESNNPQLEVQTPDAPEALDLLKQLAAENAYQSRCAKRQFHLSCVRTAASVAMLVLVVVVAAVFLPRLQQTLTQVDAVLENLESSTGELSTLAPQLSQSVPALIENLDSLTQTSSQEIATALQKISSLDVDSLNTAIRDLQSIVEPLAKLFGTR